MKTHDARVEAMYGRDKLAAITAVIAVWAVYAFVFWRMVSQFEGVGITILMAVLAGLVLLLNTASITALIRHYQEDKAAIYGTDIYYLDRIEAEKRATR